LTPVTGSPFANPDQSSPSSSVDCNCGNNLLFHSKASYAPSIEVISIDASGTLSASAIPGSPFTMAGALNSSVGVLSPDDRFLFVTNQYSSTVSAFNVAADGTLSSVAGSPFTTTGLTSPGGLATSQDGKLLYVASRDSKIAVFKVDATGALTSAGELVPTGAPGIPLISLAAYPGKQCGCAAPAISNVFATPKEIWTPNHKMVSARLDYTVTAAQNCLNTCKLSVTSNETVNGGNDGNTSVDWQVLDEHRVMLRAERSGEGTGRIYTLSVICTNNDALKKSATAQATVSVPLER
jgi:DNA-binding beta-propeller fold protein YncE